MNSYSISGRQSSQIVLTIYLSAMIAACAAPHKPVAETGSAEDGVGRTHALIVQNDTPREVFSIACSTATRCSEQCGTRVK